MSGLRSSAGVQVLDGMKRVRSGETVRWLGTLLLALRARIRALSLPYAKPLPSWHLRCDGVEGVNEGNGMNYRAWSDARSSGGPGIMPLLILGTETSHGRLCPGLGAASFAPSVPPPAQED